MGGFVLYPSKEKLSNQVTELFIKKGFSKPIEYKLNNFNLLIYQKQFINIENIVQIDKSRLFVTGTLVYKNNDYSKSIKYLCKDLINNQLNPKLLYGNYFALFEHNSNLYFLTDPDSLYNIYFNTTNNLLSSSFLAAVFSSSKKLKLNKFAIYETFATGSLIGPDTLISEIIRLEPDYALPIGFPKKINTAYNIEYKNFKNVKDAVNYQLSVLDNYFRDINEFMKSNVIISGLTGGFDSRLLYVLLRKKKISFTPYTTWRKYKTLEIKCAEDLVKTDNKKIQLIEHSDLTGIHKNEFFLQSKANFYFNDGLIRIFQIWLEEIKSREYLKKLLNGGTLNLSGVCGEQYRNAEYLPNKLFNIKTWITYELISKNGGTAFLCNDDFKELIERIEKKVKIRIKLEKEKIISYSEIKQFYNTIYNSANRTIRNSIENQSIFFLSPFSEYRLTRESYSAIPFLGSSHEFQKEMIKLTAPEFENIMLDYGYQISAEIPLKYRAVANIKNILGLKLYYYLYNYTKKTNSENLYELLNEKFKDFKNYSTEFKEIGLNIDFQFFKSNNLFIPLLYEFLIFVNELEDILEYA